MNSETLLYIIPVLGLVGLLYTWLKSSWVARQDAGTERMVKIAAAIQQGAMAFLRAENTGCSRSSSSSWRSSSACRAPCRRSPTR